MGNLLLPVNHADLIESVDRGRQPTVDAQNLVFDKSRQAQVVEDLRAVTPHVHRSVFAKALVVEAVHLSDLPTFVVAPDQCYSIRIPNLQVEIGLVGLGWFAC